MTTMNLKQRPGEIPTLKPVQDDTPKADNGYDHAAGSPMNLTRVLRLLSDCDNQPDWRLRADVAAAFVDGKQFTPEQQAALTAEGMPDVRPTNLVGRVIRSVCGQEAKARTDIKVECDDDEFADVADVLNASMKESQRESYADMAISEAYFGQVGPGLGWVEVTDNPDPLGYPDIVQSVHRSEMWWDWHSQDVIGRNARWQMRKRWCDLDELEARMPQFKDLFRQVTNGWAGPVQLDDIDEPTFGRTNLVNCYRDEQRWSQYRRRSDWFDSARKRVKLFEVWYKVPAMGVIMQWGPSRKLLFNPANRMHVQALLSGAVKVSKQLTTQIRMSLFAGPHRIQDIGTSRRSFPFVPFFAYRDDQDLSPYGLVEGMISPQTEYNARRIRINWLLRSRQVQLDADALDEKSNSLSDVLDTLMRPDATIVTNPNRVNKAQDAIKIGNALALQKEQVDVMQDAKQLIQDVPGVYGSQLGQSAAGVTSGIANSLLIEQGAVAMNDLNDNYRHARRAVFELLLENIVQRHLEMDLKVKIGMGSSSRVVVLNHFDPQTGAMENNVEDAPTRVGLGEVPSTPAFRMQQQQQLATIMQSLQSMPAAVAVLAPSFIEATDLPDRMDRADDLRRATGQPTAGDRAQKAEIQQQQAQQAQQEAQLKSAMAQLSLQEAGAKVANLNSQTQLNDAKTWQIGHSEGLQQASTVYDNPQNNEDPEADRQRLIAEAMQEAKGSPPVSAAVAGLGQRPVEQPA